MPHPTRRRNMHVRRGRIDRGLVPKLPEITGNCLVRAQREVHRTSATPLPQANCRNSQQHPSEIVDASAHVDYSRTQIYENSKAKNTKCCPPLPQVPCINGDISLGIPQSHPLDLNWRFVSLKQPLAGRSVMNTALESTLPTKENSMQEEYSARLHSLSHTCTLTTTSCRKSMMLPTTSNQLLANLNR